MNLHLQHIQRRAFPNTGCMSPIETASFNVGVTMICTCIINWRRKTEDKANIVSVSSFEQVPGAQVAARARLPHVTSGISPVCRPIMELKPSTDHKLLQAHGPSLNQS